MELTRRICAERSSEVSLTKMLPKMKRGIEVSVGIPGSSLTKTEMLTTSCMYDNALAR